MSSLLLANPRRRKAKRKAPARRRKAMSVSRHSRRRRRNPIGGNDLMSQVKNAAIGAAGAIAVDVAMSKLPIPANLTSGPMLPAVKGAIAIGLGMLIGKFGKKRALGKQIAEGGLTVAIHSMAKPMVANMIPGGLSGDDDLMGYDLMGDDFMGEDDLFDTRSDVGQYVSGDDDVFEDMSGIDDFEDDFED